MRANTTAILGLDVETYSSVDLKRVGAESYARHPSTGVHCAVMRFATWDRIDPKPIVWTPGVRLPSGVPLHIASGQPVLAHNLSFEAAIIRHILHPKHGWPTVPLANWRDTMARAAELALPTKLEGLARALGTAVKKDMVGNKLMKKLAKSSVITADELAMLIDYCDTDVVAMLQCFQKLPRTRLGFEIETEALDRRVNARGVCLDLCLVDAIGAIVRDRRNQLDESVTELTNGEMVTLTSGPSLRDWLTERGVKLPMARRVKGDVVKFSPTADRATVEVLVEDESLPPEVLRVLRTRVELGRATSLAKLLRVQSMVSSDGRLRQAFAYCGAHTGRWASRGLQLHNLPRSPKEFAKAAPLLLDAVLDGDMETALELAPNLLQALSWLLRSVVVAGPGRDLIGGDFSAIEARVLAWLAGQDDVLEMFASGTDVYTEDARRVGSDNRQFGKMQRLALGYGMGVATLQKKAHSQFGLEIDLKTAAKTQRAWRKHNASIVQWWLDLERGAKAAIAAPGSVFRAGKHVTLLAVANKDRSKVQLLKIRLPSGRTLHYWRPGIRIRKHKVEVYDDATEKLISKEVTVPELFYHTEGPDRVRMVPEGAYGGKLAENVTQAVSRDLLAEAMLRLDATPIYPVVAHVHDSILSEVRRGKGSVEEHSRIMATVPTWAPGLPIAVDGYRAQHFRG